MEEVTTVKIEIPNYGVEGALYGAFSSGGIAYWARTGRAKRDGATEIDLAPLRPNGYIKIIDIEDGNRLYTLDFIKLERGLSLMATKAPYQFASIITGNFDKFTGDVLVQLSIFGEVKYG